MIKKENIFSYKIWILNIAYYCIFVFAFFSKNNKSLIKRKLKIGALIISISALYSCNTYKHANHKLTNQDNKKDTTNSENSISNDRIHKNYPPPTCYAPPPPKK